jgi:tRNA (guanine-N7-)-methyltransferase
MTPDRPIRRRSVYADRLLPFSQFTFSDGAEFARAGRWRGFFAERIGPSFDGRIIFEIGCNDASFLARIAANHPASAFVGVDWKCRALHTAAERIDAMSLKNVALLHGRAQDIRRFFADGELAEIWLFHPDPCDKPRELANRLFAEPFLADAHRALTRGGSLTLKTDHADYYQGAIAVAARMANRFDVAASSPDYWNDAAVQSMTSGRAFAGESTFYEARFRRKRMSIAYLELCGRATGPHQPVSLTELP